MSWGIAETAPEIEKIKSVSADYLGGLNSCGEIEWGIYSQAFDFYADLIQKAYELGKTEAKLHWIPVAKRLPEESGLYQVTDMQGHVVRYVFNANKSSVEYWRRCVKAWMPLPESYKGD